MPIVLEHPTVAGAHYFQRLSSERPLAGTIGVNVLLDKDRILGTGDVVTATIVTSRTNLTAGNFSVQVTPLVANTTYAPSPLVVVATSDPQIWTCAITVTSTATNITQREAVTVSITDGTEHGYGQATFTLVRSTPTTVGTLVATGQPNAIMLGWAPSSDPHVLKYRVYRANGAGASYTSAVAIGYTVGAAYIDAPLVQGVFYTYFVAAVSDLGVEGSLAGQAGASAAALGDITVKVELSKIRTGGTSTIPFKLFSSVAAATSNWTLTMAPSGLSYVSIGAISTLSGGGTDTVFTGTITLTKTTPAERVPLVLTAAVERDNKKGTGFASFEIDTLAPSAAYGLQATGRIDSIFLTWTGSSDDDVAYYKVYRSQQDIATTLDAGAIATIIAGSSESNLRSTTTTAFFLDGATDNGALGNPPDATTLVSNAYQYVYWVKEVDSFGNVGPASAGCVGKPRQIITQDLIDAGIDLSRVAADTSITAAKLSGGLITATKLGVLQAAFDAASTFTSNAKLTGGGSYASNGTTVVPNGALQTGQSGYVAWRNLVLVTGGKKYPITWYSQTTGTGRVTMSGTTATFTVSQNGRLDVNDIITVGGTNYTITQKTSGVSYQVSPSGSYVNLTFQITQNDPSGKYFGYTNKKIIWWSATTQTVRASNPYVRPKTRTGAISSADTTSSEWLNPMGDGVPCFEASFNQFVNPSDPTLVDVILGYNTPRPDSPQGGNFQPEYGGTVINGSSILTGTIEARTIVTNELSAITANIGTITAGLLKSANVLTVNGVSNVPWGLIRLSLNDPKDNSVTYTVPIDSSPRTIAAEYGRAPQSPRVIDLVAKDWTGSGADQTNTTDNFRFISVRGLKNGVWEDKFVVSTSGSVFLRGAVAATSLELRPEGLGNNQQVPGFTQYFSDTGIVFQVISGWTAATSSVNINGAMMVAAGGSIAGGLSLNGLITVGPWGAYNSPSTIEVLADVDRDTDANNTSTAAQKLAAQIGVYTRGSSSTVTAQSVGSGSFSGSFPLTATAYGITTPVYTSYGTYMTAAGNWANADHSYLITGRVDLTVESGDPVAAMTTLTVEMSANGSTWENVYTTTFIGTGIAGLTQVPFSQILQPGTQPAAGGSHYVRLGASVRVTTQPNDHDYYAIVQVYLDGSTALTWSVRSTSGDITRTGIFARPTYKSGTYCPGFALEPFPSWEDGTHVTARPGEFGIFTNNNAFNVMVFDGTTWISTLSTQIPTAAANTLGGVKITETSSGLKMTSGQLSVKYGTGLSIDGSGYLNATAQGLTHATDTALGGIKVGINAASAGLKMGGLNSDFLQLNIGTGLSFNGTTGALDAAGTYVLPTAGASTLGGVMINTGASAAGLQMSGNYLQLKVGTGVAINGSGQLEYLLPTASSVTKGGVIINGSGLSINSSTALLSVTAATTGAIGGVIVGNGLSVSAGTISANVLSVAGMTGAVALSCANISPGTFPAGTVTVSGQAVATSFSTTGTVYGGSLVISSSSGTLGGIQIATHSVGTASALSGWLLPLSGGTLSGALTINNNLTVGGVGSAYTIMLNNKAIPTVTLSTMTPTQAGATGVNGQIWFQVTE